MKIQLTKNNRVLALLAFFSALCLFNIIPANAQRQAFPALDQKLDPLRTRFNKDVGKVRLIVIVDPTCPPCRWGASEIQKDVMETIQTDRLAVYVVWIPVLNFQDEPTLQKNGLKESSRLSDSRAIHYIDPLGFSGKEYSSILNFPYHSPAWDVYLVFGSEARWDNRPPSPSDWMYQGEGLGRARLLDGHKMAQQVQKLLASTSAKSGQ